MREERASQGARLCAGRWTMGPRSHAAFGDESGHPAAERTPDGPEDVQGVGRGELTRVNKCASPVGTSSDMYVRNQLRTK